MPTLLLSRLSGRKRQLSHHTGSRLRRFENVGGPPPPVPKATSLSTLRLNLILYQSNNIVLLLLYQLPELYPFEPAEGVLPRPESDTGKAM